MGYEAATVRFGARRLLVAHPNEHMYGHLGLEIGMSLAHARREGADVYFIRPSTQLGSGLFELESPEVRVLRPRPIVGDLLRTCISWSRILERIDGWRHDVLAQVEHAFVREVAPYVADPDMPVEVRQRLRRARKRVRASIAQTARDRRRRPQYYQRRLLREPVPVQLKASAREEAARQARAHGIAEDAKLVCIHSREAGYKRGVELHDVKPDGRDDRSRNAPIESYLEAIDHLMHRGYQVVRLGDPSMVPLAHPGVVDLATSPGRTNLLEVYCLLRCEFILCGESAFANVVYLTNTPMLLVNATEPISVYPIRAPGLFLTKSVVDRQTGARLRPDDMFGPDYHRQFRDTRRFQYIDNSPAQILDATQEMLDWVEERWTESESQRRYHDAITAGTAWLWSRSQWVRKWGLDDGFLGDGRIARIALSTQ